MLCGSQCTRRLLVVNDNKIIKDSKKEIEKYGIRFKLKPQNVYKMIEKNLNRYRASRIN